MSQIKKQIVLGSFVVVAVVAAFSLLAVINTREEVVAQVSAQPAVIMEVMDPSLNQYANLWQKEIGRRFPNAVGILCHGGEFVEGQWIIGAQTYGRITTADAIVDHFKAKYPGRTIVLLSCNPGHLHLHTRGVYHAMDSVWCVPDRDVDGQYANRMTKLDDGDEDPSVPSEERGGRSQKAEKQPGRSEVEPNIVGNIYEFVAD